MFFFGECLMTKFIFIIIINVLVISPAIADDIYRWTDPETGKTMSAPYLPPYPIKEKRLAGQLPNGNVIQVILDPNSPELKAIVKRQKEEEAEKRRVAEQRVKEQAIRETEQQRIAEEQAKAQAAREALEVEQKRLAQEKEETERVAQKKAEQIEQKRLMQEKAEAEQIAKEQIAEERLIQERKSETQEILNSKNDAWDSFFAGPFQGMKDNTEEDSASNSNQKMGMRVNEKLSSISHVWASLSSSPSQEEIDVEPVVQEKDQARQELLAQEKEETERSIQKRAKQERLAQEKEQAENFAQKKTEQKRLAQENLAGSPVIKGFYIGMSKDAIIKLLKEIAKGVNESGKTEINAVLGKLDEMDKLEDRLKKGTATDDEKKQIILLTALTGGFITTSTDSDNIPSMMKIQEDKLVTAIFSPIAFNARGVPVKDFVRSFMDAYKITEMKGGECIGAYLPSGKASCYSYEDSNKGFAIEIVLDEYGKISIIILKAIGSTKNLKF